MKSVALIAISIIFASFFDNCLAEEFITKDEQKNMLSIIRERDSLVKQEKLEYFLLNKNELVNFLGMPSLSIACIENGDYLSAQNHATNMLKLAHNFKDHWNYGNVIHDGNMILGIVEIHNNNIIAAKKRLKQAGLAPTSPQAEVYGPNMLLADALLDIGENEVVKSYLESLKKTWTKNDGRIDSWIAAINGGGRPYFGLNLPVKYKESTP